MLRRIGIILFILLKSPYRYGYIPPINTRYIYRNVLLPLCSSAQGNSPRWFQEKDLPSNDDVNFIFGAVSDNKQENKVENQVFSKNQRIIPIFPLDDGCVLPVGVFSMHIFVMKFRQMMNDIQNNGKLLGLSMSDGKGNICEIGTVLHNSGRELLPDGRQLCTFDVISRLKVIKILQREPYIKALVEINVTDEEVALAKDSGEGLPIHLCKLEIELWELVKGILNKVSEVVPDPELRYIRQNFPLMLAPKEIDDSWSLAAIDAWKFNDESNAYSLEVDARKARVELVTPFTFAMASILEVTGMLPEGAKQSMMECTSLETRLITLIKAHTLFKNLLLLSRGENDNDTKAFIPTDL